MSENRVLWVDVGDGARMSMPHPEWPWQLTYGRDISVPPQCSDRMLAASVCASYLYLLTECTKEEAWHRIKIMRKAIQEQATPPRGSDTK